MRRKYCVNYHGGGVGLDPLEEVVHEQATHGVARQDHLLAAVQLQNQAAAMRKTL